MDRLLVVDDDERIRSLLAEYLGGRGFVVETARDGREAVEKVRGQAPDLVVLDLNLPVQDGMSATREIRGFSQVPIIMLTARGDDTDRIVGLELGADDYLAKPFNPRELVARIEAVLRRTRPRAPDNAPVTVGPLVVDHDRREVRVGGVVVELTTTEFDLLRALVAHAGRVLPRERLMELARGEDWASFERSVDVHVSHLRKKLGDDARSPWLIKTVRGVGYTLPRNPAPPGSEG